MVIRDLVLGIDGGATKTVAWLAPRAATEECRPVGRGIAGPSNLQAIAGVEALANLDRAIGAAFADANIERGPLAAAVLALAGSDRPQNQRRICQWAHQRQIAERIDVVHDAMGLLAAGSAQGWGIALIAGTGSLAFGRCRDGRTARAGGWGYLFGDEGSAYAIAVAGLRAAAQAADGRGPSTQILPALLARMSVPDAMALIPAVYSLAAERASVAALAEVVCAAAEAGDEGAQQILDAGARDLAVMVVAVARRLELIAVEFPLALAGGLLLGNARIRSRLFASLPSLRLHAAPVTLVADPVAGAIRLAQQLLAEHAP
jgi:N-acetylmuramic acid 6-phosphate etherase